MENENRLKIIFYIFLKIVQLYFHLTDCIKEPFFPQLCLKINWNAQFWTFFSKMCTFIRKNAFSVAWIRLLTNSMRLSIKVLSTVYYTEINQFRFKNKKWVRLAESSSSLILFSVMLCGFWKGSSIRCFRVWINFLGISRIYQ